LSLEFLLGLLPKQLKKQEPGKGEEVGSSVLFMDTFCLHLIHPQLLSRRQAVIRYSKLELITFSFSSSIEIEGD